MEKKKDTTCHCDEECCCDEHCECEAEETVNLVEKAEKEIETLKDALLRTHAEMENIRKRTIKEKEDSLKFANTKFAKELLEVMDNFDRALENATDAEKNAKNFYDGIKLTHKTLLAAFVKNGITKIETKKSDVFDPGIHQIMCEVASEDIGEGKIVDIYQSGYMINGRLLRPTLVSVAKKKL